jgi:hypothetical protein
VAVTPGAFSVSSFVSMTAIDSVCAAFGHDMISAIDPTRETQRGGIH